MTEPSDGGASAAALSAFRVTVCEFLTGAAFSYDYDSANRPVIDGRFLPLVLPQRRPFKAFPLSKGGRRRRMGPCRQYGVKNEQGRTVAEHQGWTKDHQSRPTTTLSSAPGDSDCRPCARIQASSAAA
jgi:hypothetical protein